MSASTYYYRATLPWTVQPEDERFRRILLAVVVAMSLFGVIVSLIPVPEPARDEIMLPPRLAKLIVQEKPKPPPPPPPVVEPTAPQPLPAVEEKKVETKPVEEPPKREKPAEKTVVLEQAPPQPSARERAARTGLLAMRDELADLRVDAVADNLEKQPLRKAGTAETGTAPESERAIITSRATAGSGGISTSRLSRDTGGTQLAGRETTRVTAPVEAESVSRGGVAAEGAKTGAPPSRSSEEIQVVFDRNKGTLNAIYNRALRQNPALAGKVVLKLTIAPSGEVTQCELISSELNDPELERKLIARVQLFDFGQKRAAATTVTYPIDFFPG
jgi:TonB family protein